MATLKYAFDMSEGDIDGAITAIGKRTQGLNKDVQCVAVSILAAFKAHGDKPTATRRMNALVLSLGKGMRRDSMLAYFEQLAPVVYNTATKQLVGGATAMSPVKEHAKINLADAIALNWYEAKAEPEYKPLADWSAFLAMAVKKAKADIEAMGDKSKVNREQLAQLEAMAAAK